ncbi:hypothetical protein DVH24_023805 [Malus domestica]|uniref:Uncharacterized protein n=1 Tax=Malus domestica TaxID=3750 RepID=A0A498I7Q7_MALDO|nr:hypothetical protein DVH24_023805 [Malus domestica]
MKFNIANPTIKCRKKLETTTTRHYVNYGTRGSLKKTELVVAHELAQYVVRADDFKSGIEEEPSWLSPLVLLVDSSC